MSSGVRERVRDLVRAETAEVAVRVFAEHGFDQTTVDDVAREAGISRATFFRYFGSKEEAVVASVESGGLDFGALLRTQASDVTGAGSAWDVLTNVFEAGMASIERDASDLRGLRARTRMITQTPSLRAHLSEKRRSQEESLVEALTDLGADPLTARVLAAIALAAYELTWQEWSAGDDAELRDVFRDVFARVPQLGAPLRPR
ncbi:MAG: TetR family transcriptional regulator [Microbacterium sp.]